MSSANGRLDDPSIPEIVETIFKTVGHPVKNAALFYALYYLVEIEGFEAARFDLKQLRERQARGFFWYGIIAITTEFGNAHGNYFINGNSAGSILDGIHDDLGPEDVRRHVREDLPLTEDVRERAVDAFMLVGDGLRTNGTAIDTETVFQRIQAQLGAVTEPVDYIRLIQAIFKRTRQFNGNDQRARNLGGTGWVIGYDGPAWVGVCDHLLRRDELSDTAWVDQSWSVEHNNSNWIDKIDFGDDENENRLIHEIIDFPQERVLGRSRPRSRPHPSWFLEATGDILDEAHDGSSGQLLEWAAIVDDDIDLSIGRARRELGL